MKEPPVRPALSGYYATKAVVSSQVSSAGGLGVGVGYWDLKLYYIITDLYRGFKAYLELQNVIKNG